MRASAALLVLALGCRAPAPPGEAATPASAAAPAAYDPCAPERTRSLKPFMECFLAPYATMGRGEEADFLRALEELKGMIPDARYARDGDPESWLAIIGTMQRTRDYKAGCKACHAAWRHDYKARYHDVPVR
ncbi:MAG: hypothetical protein ACK4N5_13385 [Myxococcales bacterium]